MTGQVQALRPEEEAAASLAAMIVAREIRTKRELELAKRQVARVFCLQSYVSNSEILDKIDDARRRDYEALLRVHPRRSGSGIVVVTAFSAPFACPHGTCVFCPGGPREGTPQSYVKDGPSMRTAIAAEFDPARQVRDALRKYSTNGHDVTKVETLIEGGTFLAVPLEYQERFVKGVYEGLNGRGAGSLAEAQEANEGAESRCVGLTIESKPDWCEPSQIDLMLAYGVTRLEVGVQSLRNAVLDATNRGHSVEDTVKAFRTAKDAGLKVVAHMMPGLPASNPEQDLSDMRRLFEEESFRPDMMKVYPTVVVRGTALERLWAAGRYAEYSLETVVELLTEVKRFIPRWHRIMRIQREIPANDIVAGVRNGNLRELVLARVNEKGFKCNCIRCREVGLDLPSSLAKDDELKLLKDVYCASQGEEVFASYEYSKSGRIAGFVRMRVPSQHHHRPEMARSCVVRELKVYGTVVPVGERVEEGWQHRGLGSSLLAEMEKVAAEEFDAGRLLVTSAVGTRRYYGRLGYRRLGPYMSKELD